jgi:nucleotide-binding universal stress UspA family protein
MFNRLLLAIDDSPGSEVATAFATAVARHHDASVHVFHVNEYRVGGRGVTLLTRDEATDLLTDAVQQLRAAGVRATGSSVVASYRDVASRIAAAAHERTVDGIVLGSERHGRLGRIFSPHVRARTTRLTSLPVLTAPSPLSVPAGRGLSLDDVASLQVPQQTVVPTP